MLLLAHVPSSDLQEDRMNVGDLKRILAEHPDETEVLVEDMRCNQDSLESVRVCDLCADEGQDGEYYATQEDAANPAEGVEFTKAERPILLLSVQPNPSARNGNVANKT